MTQVINLFLIIFFSIRLVFFYLTENSKTTEDNAPGSKKEKILIKLLHKRNAEKVKIWKDHEHDKSDVVLRRGNINKVNDIDDDPMLWEQRPRRPKIAFR